MKQKYLLKKVTTTNVGDQIDTKALFKHYPVVQEKPEKAPGRDFKRG